MICKLHGILESLEEDTARVTLDSGVTYEVLLPSYACGRLAQQIGRPVTLHTIQYLEGSSQSSNFTPRLAGFLSAADRAFFEQFTSVKGIGPRKALRSMSLSTGQIAAAIADRDAKTLQSLPEIGKRTAETIVAALHGKVDRFISDTAFAGSSEDGDSPGGASRSTPGRAAAREALEVLLQLGENRAQAIAWIDEILTAQPDLDDSQQIISEVLRRKTGV